MCGLAGCFVPPGYGHGYPVAGYAPYSYGWPVYGRGYAPVFAVHHPWEAHFQGVEHHTSFVHAGGYGGPAAAGHSGEGRR